MKKITHRILLLKETREEIANLYHRDQLIQKLHNLKQEHDDLIPGRDYPKLMLKVGLTALLMGLLMKVVLDQSTSENPILTAFLLAFLVGGVLIMWLGMVVVEDPQASERHQQREIELEDKLSSIARINRILTSAPSKLYPLVGRLCVHRFLEAGSEADPHHYQLLAVHDLATFDSTEPDRSINLHKIDDYVRVLLQGSDALNYEVEIDEQIIYLTRVQKERWEELGFSNKSDYTHNQGLDHPFSEARLYYISQQHGWGDLKRVQSILTRAGINESSEKTMTARIEACIDAGYTPSTIHHLKPVIDLRGPYFISEYPKQRLVDDNPASIRDLVMVDKGGFSDLDQYLKYKPYRITSHADIFYIEQLLELMEGDKDVDANELRQVNETYAKKIGLEMISYRQLYLILKSNMTPRVFALLQPGSADFDKQVLKQFRSRYQKVDWEVVPVSDVVPFENFLQTIYTA